MALYGYLENNMHHLPLRIYYEDTDAGGVVYHSNYLKFAERARTEMLRAHGINRKELEEEGFIFVVRKVEADYMKPAQLYDDLVVRTEVTELGGASMTLTQNILKEDVEIVCLRVILVCVNKDMKPVRINNKIKGQLSHG